MSGADFETSQDMQTDASIMHLLGRDNAATELQNSGQALQRGSTAAQVPELPLSNADQLLGAKVLQGTLTLATLGELAGEGFAGLLKKFAESGEKEATQNPKLLEQVEKLKADTTENKSLPKNVAVEKKEISLRDETDNSPGDGVTITKKPPSLEDLIDRIKRTPGQRILIGTNDRIAIIGRPMGDGTSDGVIKFANQLRSEGYTVDTFDGDEVSETATQEFEVKKRKEGARLPPDECRRTTLFAENQRWVLKVKGQGDTIIDYGNPLNKSDVSAFYNMEREKVFGDVFPNE